MSLVKIHHLHIGYQMRWTMDDRLGAVQRREEVIRPSDTHQITHNGVVYDILPDLSFEVPEDVAEFYIARPALGWRPGPNLFFVEDSDVDPEVPFGEPTGTTKTRPRARKGK